MGRSPDIRRRVTSLAFLFCASFPPCWKNVSKRRSRARFTLRSEEILTGAIPSAKDGADGPLRDRKIQGSDLAHDFIPTGEFCQLSGSRELNFFVWISEWGVIQAEDLRLTNPFTRGPATQRMHYAPWLRLRRPACCIVQALLPTLSACPT